VSFKNDIGNRIDGLELYLRSHFPNQTSDDFGLLSQRVTQTTSPLTATDPRRPAVTVAIPPVSNLTNQSITLPAAAIDPKHLAIVKLGDEEFACDRTQVNDPPARHFSDNISGLFEHWHHSDYLVVNGRGIPIKYWPEFYKAKKGFKAGAWKAICVEWGNWKVNFHILLLIQVSHLFGHLSSWLRSARNIQPKPNSGPNSPTRIQACDLAFKKSWTPSRKNGPNVMYMMRRMPISSSMETLAMLMQTAHSPTHQRLGTQL
jgi:hypothetical protein